MPPSPPPPGPTSPDKPFEISRRRSLEKESAFDFLKGNGDEEIEPAAGESGSSIATAAGDGQVTEKKSKKAHRKKTFPPDSFVGSFNIMTASAIGSGVLALPWAVKSSGVVLGISIMALCGLVTNLTMTILMLAAVKTGCQSYADLLGLCIGSAAGPVIDILIFFEILLSVTCNFIFMGDFAAELLTPFGVPSWMLETRNLIILSLMIIWPLCIPKKMSVLRHVSGVSLLSLFYTACVVALQAPWFFGEAVEKADLAGGETHTGGKQGGVVLYRWGVGALKTFNIGTFAYFNHFNVIPVANEMKQPSIERIWSLSISCSTFLFIFFTVLATCGYLSWLEETKEDFICNYPLDNPLMQVARVLLFFVMVLIVPLQVYPMRASLSGFVSWALTPSQSSSLEKGTRGGRLEEGPSDRLIPQSQQWPEVKRPRGKGNAVTGVGGGSVQQEREGQYGAVSERGGIGKERGGETGGRDPEARPPPEVTPVPRSGENGQPSGGLGVSGVSVETTQTTEREKTEGGEDWGEKLASNDVVRAVVVTVILVTAVINAILCPHVANLIALMGGSFDTLFVLFFPLVIYHCVLAPSQSAPVSLGVRCILGLFSLVSVIGAYVTISEMLFGVSPETSV
uniref:Amino acid transporter transmembrane domain-containing protein n=1 Tax=Chromera velia CCMP2878 TaxID=1169474 RepID=A0A0G4HKS3_9ALVE|mmetsp:Transcript_54213/g.106060  ORF Transcript_54213/g.106060 Transcript_54213/m.106060 type:complete len:625 (-) Transcript_54213:444-2318(-)|eukprot:Cvel_7261.t1-p1 / transcript=Cvel_7261.t1 / gene=Cvel_7261 / organism=Chromera_velia_CCMP2878 / gene_product=Vacuolar amino acid transporter 7, putative / transcript_product=Vacuolar amino acid transporter 7, putative / location=Cvel_scaffold375:25633-33861(-) / protein_length=624 / sequence_SO=supercontig / SO=protein_coding / is_pseudo=false